MRILRPQGNGSTITNLWVRNKTLPFQKHHMLQSLFFFQQYYISTHNKGKGSMHTRWSITSFPSCSANLTLVHPKGLKGRKPRYYQSCKLHAEISSHPIQMPHGFKLSTSRKKCQGTYRNCCGHYWNIHSQSRIIMKKARKTATRTFRLRENKDIFVWSLPHMQKQ